MSQGELHRTKEWLRKRGIDATRIDDSLLKVGKFLVNVKESQGTGDRTNQRWPFNLRRRLPVKIDFYIFRLRGPSFPSHALSLVVPASELKGVPAIEISYRSIGGRWAPYLDNTKQLE